MTNRERVLAMTLLGVIVFLGGGVLFHLFVYEPVTQAREQLRLAEEQLQKKRNDLLQEEKQIDAVQRINPRLSQWQKISLPPRDPQAKVKPGVSAEELKRKHLTQMQVEYERFLSELMRSSGFRGDSIAIASRQPDRRSTAPALKGKEPVYERMAFGVSGRGTTDNLVRLLRSFHRTELLHQVRSLTVGLATERLGSSASARTSSAGLLDVSMSVEALFVQGAEERTTLLPEKLGYPPRVLASDPPRDYAQMVKVNMFTGVAPPPPPPPPPPEKEPSTAPETEDRIEVLRFVKLTSLWCDEGLRRWEGTLYDQAKGGPEKKINMRFRDEFTIYDKDENKILEAKVVHIDAKQMIFKSDGKFYRMRCGDFMYPAVKTPVPTRELEELGISVKEDAKP